MKFVIALMIGFSSLAFACPDFTGRYVYEQDQSMKFNMVQTECSNLQVDASMQGRDVSFAYILDGHYRTWAEGLYVASEMRTESMYVSSVALQDGTLTSTEQSYKLDQDTNMTVDTNIYDADGKLVWSQTAKFLRQK